MGGITVGTAVKIRELLDQIVELCPWALVTERCGLTDIDDQVEQHSRVKLVSPLSDHFDE
jgi:hypothetical protein